MAVGMIENKLTLAIDPGTHCGIAIYDPKQKKIVKIHSTDFFGAFTFLKTLDRAEFNIVVEVPGEYVYKRNDGEKGMSRDVMIFRMGGTRREGQLMAKGCRILGFNVKEVLPVAAKKWDAAQMKREIGFDEPTNQHVRDAARLAHHYSSEFLRG